MGKPTAGSGRGAQTYNELPVFLPRTLDILLARRRLDEPSEILLHSLDALNVASHLRRKQGR